MCIIYKSENKTLLVLHSGDQLQNKERSYFIVVLLGLVPLFLFPVYLLSFHVSQAPGFHVLSKTKKSPQPILPKGKSYSSSRRNQKASSSVGETSLYPESTSWLQTHNLLQVCFFFPGHSQPGSSQGSPCGLDQVPSPQSLISSSSTPLVKNEQNQVCVCVCLCFLTLGLYRMSFFSYIQGVYWGLRMKLWMSVYCMTSSPSKNLLKSLKTFFIWLYKCNFCCC